MSAVVCGKRSLFDDLHGSPPISKRIRCGGSSPIRFQSVVSPVRIGPAAGSDVGSLGRPSVSYLDDQLPQLRALFSEMDGELVERFFLSCGKNLDSAIKSLNDLRLSSNEQLSRSCETAVHPGAPAAAVPSSANCVVSNEDCAFAGYLQAPAAQDPSADIKLSVAQGLLPIEGLEWVDMLVQEIMSASSIDDARIRAIRALEAFEKTVASRSEVSAEVLRKENTALREQLQGLLRDNHILKRAVTIQHERQLEHEERSREMQTLKQLFTQQQEQLRMLELNNYALNLHLRKAQEGSSIPGRFHPDLF